ncbi:MAG: replicative DNA helicase [Planctomycetota bacterium]|jgi:replicative DNA helicase
MSQTQAGPTSDTDSGGLHRVPPHSIEAEACVLGSMILDAQAIDLVIQIIQDDAFYRPVHQRIFNVLVDMRHHGKPIDLVTVKDDLDRRGHLETIGGVEYLAALAEGVPTSANAEHYAHIVRDKAMLRQLIRAGTDIVRDAYGSTDDAQTVVDQAEQAIFDVAQQHIGDQAVSLNTLLDQTFETLLKHEGQLITGLASGYPALDELTSGFQKGEMIILAARPSMGKTSLLLNLAEHMAVIDNVPVAIFSLEMSKGQLAERFLASHARFNLRQMRRGTISPETWTTLQAAAGTLQPAPIYVDDSANLTIVQMMAKARRLKAAYDIQCICVDYLQLMTYFGRANSRQEQITEISRGIKALARDLEIPVVVAAQLNRGPADRPTHTPRMSDLRESGSIEQDADVVMLLHNEDYYHLAEEGYIPKGVTDLIIAKQRNGPTGTVSLTFLKDYTRFEPAAPVDDWATG